MASLASVRRRLWRRTLLVLLWVYTATAAAGAVGMMGGALLSDCGGVRFGAYCVVWAVLLGLAAFALHRRGRTLLARDPERTDVAWRRTSFMPGLEAWTLPAERGPAARPARPGGAGARGTDCFHRNTGMYICYIHDMSEPVIESMAEVRSHLADVIDRARRDETPTIITRRGRQEAVVIDINEYQRLRDLAEQVEEAWLNRLADEAESEGAEGAVSLEEMAALLRDQHG